MTMRLFTLMAVFAAGAVCLAQEEGVEKPRERGMGAQPIDREQMRANQMERRIRFIRRQLDLDEEQQRQFDQIAEKYKTDQTAGPNDARVQELLKEMGEARKANDEQRIKDIQAELQQLRGDDALDPFLTEVEKILREDQIEKLGEIRARMNSRMGRDRGPLAQLERLRGELKLNEEQARHYDELFTELKAKAAPGKEGGEDSQLIQELMKAVQEDNQERIKELREQVKANSGNQEKYVAEFLDKVESFLEPAQKRTLEQFRSEMKSRRGGLQLRDYFQYASRLELDEQQRDTLKNLQHDSREAERETKRDPAAAGKLTDEYVKKIRDMLTDEQCAKFDQWVAEQKSKEERGDRRGRGDGKERGERRAHRPRGEDQPAPGEPQEPEPQEPENP
jgi:hypothetical protein